MVKPGEPWFVPSTPIMVLLSSQLKWKEDQAASPALWGSGSQPLVGTYLGLTTQKELQETERIFEDNPLSTPNLLMLYFNSAKAQEMCTYFFITMQNIQHLKLQYP